MAEFLGFLGSIVAVDPIIVAAALTLSGTLTTTWMTLRLRRDVKTNHGKRPGEYLEMIPYILDHMAAHDIQDAQRFSSVDQQLAELRAQATSNFNDVRSAQDYPQGDKPDS